MEKFEPLCDKSTGTKTMSSAQAFGAEDAAMYAKRMLERESRGWGDQSNALDKIGRKCGMSSRSLRRLLNGERKDGGARVFHGVRSAYLDHCSRLIAGLQAELDADQRKYGDAALADLENEVQALVAKLEKERERLKG